MAEKIGKEYINNAVDELVAMLGTKDDVDHEYIFIPLRKGNVKECIKHVAICLGLPIEIDLSYVSEYDKQGTFGNGFTVGGDGGTDRFESSELVKTDSEGGGTQGITAQVLIPQDLPFYGSSRLNGLPIKVKVGKNCLNHPETFVALISHELSHVLLATIASKQANNEIYTDITPLLLGFSKIVRDGRMTMENTYKHGLLSTTTTTHTTNYGYLDDDQFVFACEKINRIMKENTSKKNKLLKLIETFENKYTLYTKYISLFKDGLVHLRSNKKSDINKVDSERIISFFNPVLDDELETFSNQNKSRLEKLKQYHSGLTHYTKHNIDILNKNTENTATFIQNIEQKIEQTKKDIRILIKYGNLSNKIKINAKYLGILISK